MIKNKKQNSLAEKTEQILLTMPRIIATQIGKDLVIQKQQENKLNLELKKLELQKKTLTEKMMMLKKKNTAASKKQAKTVQKSLQKTQKMITVVARDLQAVKKQVQTLSQKKNMYTALQAQLVSFQKEWVKKMSSQAKAKAKPKTKTKAKVKAKKRSASTKMSEMRKSPLSMTNKAQASQLMEVMKAPVQEEAEFAQEELVENVS
jgi:hypothetical protein